jgi:hypothetical protein
MVSQRDESIRKNVAYTEIFIITAIILSLILKFRLIFLLNIDGDEFSFLAVVYQYVRGSLASPYFTFHVHLFSWLTALPGDEVSRIIAARTFMFFLGIGTCTLLYFTGRLFLNRIGALFAVLCYLSVSNVMVHGTSFRFDPICAFLFQGVVYLILRKDCSSTRYLIAGLGIALSFLITLKTVFYFIPLAGIFFCNVLFSGNKKDAALNCVFFLISFAIGTIALFVFHAHSLPVAGVTGNGEYLVRLSRSRFLFYEFFPNKFYIFRSVFENLFPTGFILAGIIILLLEATRREKMPENCFLLCLLGPFISLSFYGFSFPYFYVFILSPGITVSGVLQDRMVERYKISGSKRLLFCIIMSYMILVVGFLGHYKKQSVDRTFTQRKIIKTIHEIFPEPVPYIDRCFMISSFPMVGIHMTSWDMEQYARANRPIMRELLVTKQPVFLIANINRLDLSLSSGVAGRDFYWVDPLLEEDFNVLKDNFIHHWGIIYIAGKHFQFDSRNTTRKFENLIPGIYTIESAGDLWVDRVLYKPGDKIRLENKSYSVAPQTTPMEVALRWGEDLYRPPDPPPTQPVLFVYYY